MPRGPPRPTTVSESPALKCCLSALQQTLRGSLLLVPADGQRATLSYAAALRTGRPSQRKGAFRWFDSRFDFHDPCTTIAERRRSAATIPFI